MPAGSSRCSAAPRRPTRTSPSCGAGSRSSSGPSLLGIVQSLGAKGVLPDGLDPERAADVVWTLNHPDVWLLLVGERGWTPAEWEAWFLASCRAQLLGR